MDGRFRTMTLGLGIAAIVVVTMGVFSSSVWAHGGQAHGPPKAATPAERAAYEAARPAFERHCARCHTTAGRKSKRKAMDHFSMDDYPFGGHHASEVGRVVLKALGIGGKRRATMPADEPGVVTGADLRAIQAWADAFEQAHRANADAGGEHAR